MADFIHYQTVEDDQLRWLLGPVAARYQRRMCDAGQGKIPVKVALRGGSDAIWDQMPHHRIHAFLRPAARISVAIQGALRTWLPYIWFADITNFDDYDTAATLLMYSASRVYIAKTKQAFSFDVMDDRTPSAMRYSIEHNLPSRLTGLEAMLRRRGRRCAPWYSRRQSAEMVAVLHRSRREMNAILATETELVEGYLSLGDPERREAGRVRIQRALRRLFYKKNFSFLSQLFEWEALRSTSSVLKTGHGFEAKIHANWRELPPLYPHEDRSFVDHAGAVNLLAA